jgi:hypothetical protein
MDRKQEGKHNRQNISRRGGKQQISWIRATFKKLKKLPASFGI